ncbi:MAG TPA: PAS domain-containing protein [Acetobacteraceae bacterium]|nr:PAS domain-containing protein [Acetobacteraceae bacterium]
MSPQPDGSRTRLHQQAPLDAAAVLESMGDAFYALDADWRFTYANRRALEFWNVQLEDLIGRTVWDVFPSMIGTYNEAALRQVAATRTPLMFEGHSPTTGAFVSVTIGIAGASGVAVYFRDITARKLAEHRLRASEEHLRLAQEAGGIGTWERSVATGVMLGSEQMYRLLGREPMPDANLLPILHHAIHPDDRAAAAEAAEAFLSRPGPLRIELRALWPNGEVHWLVFIGRTDAGPDGRPERMLGVCIDGTARRRQEEALREAAERLRLAMKAGGLATWELDVASGRRDWSPEAAVMHGFPPDKTSMSRREWGSFILPEDRPRVVRTFDAAVASGQDYACEYRIRHVDGTIRWTASSGSMLRDDQGRMVRIVGVVQDITARRRDEERLRELNRELEARVAAEIAARQAAQARAAHAERMQALGQLAGGIAHDFNNVLQAVQGGAALIERRSADPEAVRRFARMVLDATARGAAITGRLLAFGRRSDLRAEPLAAADVLEGLHEILEHALGAQIDVLVQAEPGLPPLLADRTQLETALVNLATNARDAMPEGGRLTLSADSETVTDPLAHRAGLSPGAYVRLRVGDTGVGMSAETLARASEPFFTTKPIGQGTGLGLAMARGFAEQSGGALAIDSRVGGGTTVTLWFPAAAAQRPPSAPGPVVDAEGAEFRVLVVADDPLVRGTLAHELESAGYHVTEAADGAEAVRLIEVGLPLDAIVTDLAMPGSDGLAVIRRAQALRPGLPAILLTGYAGEGAALALGGALSGSFSLLRKPVSREQLCDRLAALLEARASARA